MLKFLRKGSYLFVSRSNIVQGRSSSFFINAKKGEPRDNNISFALKASEAAEIIYAYDHANDGTHVDLLFIHTTDNYQKVLKIMGREYKGNIVFGISINQNNKDKTEKKFVMMLTLGEFTLMVMYLKKYVVSMGVSTQ